jgi:GT2 family glycosyltransferase
MLARREALDAVHGFDERFFLYWEDADLCRRLRAKGYHVRYVPGASAIHRVGQSSRRPRDRRSARSIEARICTTPHTWRPRRSARSGRWRERFFGTRCWMQLRDGTGP